MNFFGVTKKSLDTIRKKPYPISTMKNNLKTKISKDGKVTFWSVYEQRWQCRYASLISSRDLATLTQRERNRIAAAAKTVNLTALLLG